MIQIRPAQLTDLATITRIYNEAVRNTTATFDVDDRTDAQQTDWFAAHGVEYPILVACKDTQVVGWTCLSPWSDREAYRLTVEASLYVDVAHRGAGLGRQLLEAILQSAARLRYHTVLARITVGNEPSLRLCRSAGFDTVGVLQEVGWKFGQYLDVYILQKVLRA